MINGGFESEFRNNNPDKGTETYRIPYSSYQAPFRNNNPDKGTETLCLSLTHRIGYSLEIITPIRGRKHIFDQVFYIIYFWFRNNNPDKGTETLFYRLL